MAEIAPCTTDAIPNAMPSSAPLARTAACDCCDKDERERILSAAAKLPPGNVRDLFEGYLAKPGGERKLGSNPKPKAILSLKGDAKKGREHFFNVKLQCINCHKLEGQGQEIGPDLRGLKRTRSDLLESILDPSRRVEPAYQSYLLKTESGKSLTGLLMKKTEKEIVLKGADGKEERIPAADVQSFSPSRTSLMPNGLIADLTPQQASDLLEFLVSLKDAPK